MKRLVLLTLCTCFLTTMFSFSSIKAEENNQDSDCVSCEIDTEEEVNEFIEKSKNYTDAEYNKVVSTVKNSDYYLEEEKLIDKDYPIDVKKLSDVSETTMYTQTFLLHSDYEDIYTDSLIFILDSKFNIVASVTSKYNGKILSVFDKVSNSEQLLRNEKQRTIDCKTWVCTDLEKNAGYEDWECTGKLGIGCGALGGWLTKLQNAVCYGGILVSCYHPPYSICWQGKWLPVCPY